ncbi:hypothetical protein JTE90_001742 [Oedothorax gibbosus]|uniref:Uncharacterized protein n=1 Tax=Oedothorax gibbosus TaxID=931172 RepID=A0AAV6V7E6_9ARAC|nr:hypothetical protein JTE90_001742 [Oedothorax gibbosus]
MLPVRSYSVRTKRRNQEIEASFKRRQEARHTPAFRSLSAGTTPLRRPAPKELLRRTMTSASEGADPPSLLLGTAGSSGSLLGQPQKTLSVESGSESG